MSNVIRFLEAAGSDAALRNATGAELDHALAAFGLDGTALEDLRAAQPRMICGLAPSRQEDKEEERPVNDDEEAQARKAA